MKTRQTTFKVVSVLFLSAGIAAAQTTTAQEQTTAPAAATAAQDQAPVASSVPTGAPPTGRQSLTEEVTVTGSRIRRKDLTTPAPVTVVTREQFESSGRATIGDYLQLLPEQGNAPNFQLNTGGINYGADGGTRINLRSLGVQRTLVLINGRRVVPAGLGATSSVDLNTIPTEAVERVEVLKDGASAVYGSDAIAGVVNTVPRKRQTHRRSMPTSPPGPPAISGVPCSRCVTSISRIPGCAIAAGRSRPSTSAIRRTVATLG